MGPIWGRHDNVGPMLSPWTLLFGQWCILRLHNTLPYFNLWISITNSVMLIQVFCFCVRWPMLLQDSFLFDPLEKSLHQVLPDFCNVQHWGEWICCDVVWMTGTRPRLLFRMVAAGARLTHWGRDKMDAISQTTFSSAFSWTKMSEFWL